MTMIYASIRSVFFTLLFTISFITHLFANEIRLDSNITAVTVYPGSAKIFRSAKTHVQAGKHTILISGLPNNLDETSLRVNGKSAANIKLGSVELQRNIEKDIVQEKEKALRDKIDALNEEREVTQDAIKRYEAQLKYIETMVLGRTLEKVKPQARSITDYVSAYQDLPLDQWTQAWDTLENATAGMQEKIRVARKTTKTQNKALKKLQRELQQIAVNQTATRSASLQIESDNHAELELEIHYHISGANWIPVYDADLDTKSGEITLKNLAQVSQRTGEDWNNITLKLSTLRPTANTQLPELYSWVIDFIPDIEMLQDQGRGFNDMMVKQALPESMIAEELTAATAQALPGRMAKAQKPMASLQSQIISSDFSAEYQVPGKITLASGSNKQRFALSTQTLETRITLATTPRIDPRAMIQASANYRGETPLLPGRMTLYRDSNFIGNTQIKQTQSGEELKLAFGEDDKVKIKFQPDPDKKRKDGILFGKRKVIERHYQLTMTSQHDKPFNIIVNEVFPTPADQEIKITRNGDVPKQQDIDDKKGVVAWHRVLKTNIPNKINYGYTLSYPEDKQISGI